MNFLFKVNFFLPSTKKKEENPIIRIFPFLFRKVKRKKEKKKKLLKQSVCGLHFNRFLFNEH